MSSNLEHQLLMAERLGRLQGKGHNAYMRSIKDSQKDALNSDLKLAERELALHFIGLSDNKIDTIIEIANYFRLLNVEKINQEIYKNSYQWQNLIESIERSDFYISEILRLESPSNLEVTGTTEEEKTINNDDSVM